MDAKNIVLKNSSLSDAELTAILSLSHGEDQTFGEYLDQKNLTVPEDIFTEICRFIGVDYVRDIPYNDIPIDLIRNISVNYAKQQHVLPLKEDSDQIWLLMSNPLNLAAQDDMKVLFNKSIRPQVTTNAKLLDAINRVYEKRTAALEGLEEIDQEDYDLDEPIIDLLEAEDDEAPVIKLVNTLLLRAVKEKSSDIHIEPYEKDMVVRFRIDGILFDIFKPPKKLQNAITSRVKVMANLNIAEKRLPQDGRIPLKLAGKDIDIRLNTVPTAFGERVVMRLQDRSNVVLELEQLGISEANLRSMEDLLTRTYGIVLVTGPTGSGKSTTLYACLTRINSVDKNIITVEDPVENRIHGIGQIQVNHKIGLDFAAGLRAILRQDPDIVMVGEIRDLETAEMAINASLTGHLVLSTIHTNDSAGAFPRLIDMGCEPFLIATSLLGVVAQRLVRLLCPHCKEKHKPSDVELESLGITRSQATKANICRPVGCSECNQKGYMGRTMIQELLLISDEIRHMIMQRADGNSIKKKAVDSGMVTLRDHGIQKVLNGLTSIEELLANTQVDQ